MVEQQTTPKPNRRPLLIGCGVLLVCVVLSCGVLTVMISQASNQFEEGVTAMEAGDCETAVSIFSELAGNPFAAESDVKVPAAAHTDTCNQYTQLVAQQNAGDVAAALAGYDDLITNSKSSPLLLTIETQIKTVFANDPAQLATPATCGRLDGFIERGWLTDLDNTLPGFYQACGQAYTAVADYSNAVLVYQRFLTAYPNHPNYETVEASLAKAAVAEARAAGAGEIPPPQATGAGSGSGPAVVVIQNDSRETLSLVFSGPEASFQTLEPCDKCEDYVGSGPEFCPELGPIGRYEVPAGTYEVVVTSFSDTEVIPFTGTWELTSGEEYYSCFFLITE